ncbi:hypothetical protein Tco_1047830 [Tanacetum coccineum]
MEAGYRSEPLPYDDGFLAATVVMTISLVSISVVGDPGEIAVILVFDSYTQRMYSTEFSVIRPDDEALDGMMDEEAQLNDYKSKC